MPADDIDYEKYSNLPPPNSLDIQLARKIMRFVDLQDVTPRWLADLKNYPHCALKAEYVFMYTDRGEFHVWQPSTSIADAWMVVERMREMGWLVSLDSSLDRTMWAVIVHHTAGLKPMVTTCKSVEMAICRAAIEAVDSTEPSL